MVCDPGLGCVCLIEWGKKIFMSCHEKSEEHWYSQHQKPSLPAARTLCSQGGKRKSGTEKAKRQHRMRPSALPVHLASTSGLAQSSWDDHSESVLFLEDLLRAADAQTLVQVNIHPQGRLHIQITPRAVRFPNIIARKWLTNDASR